MESIINSSRCSAGRLTLAGRWIRAKEDPDIRVVRDRFEAFVQVGSVVTVTGVAVEDRRPITDRLLQ
jgi:undecaprenyl pyrophosphate phosphatase UppP